MENDPFWRESGVEVVFSGSDCPGEGEHKVMDFIRRMRQRDNWSPEFRHVFYGLDADLIMLSLVTHERNFMLLREKASVRHGPRAKNPMDYVREDFELLEVCEFESYSKFFL
jgi:5'-3' exoribonuclease 1